MDLIAVLQSPKVAAALLIAWQTAEVYLGLKKPMDAGSIPQLLCRLVQYIVSVVRRAPGIQPAGRENPMTSANPNARPITTDVDGPTYDALGIVVEAIQKLASGESPQQVVQEEMGKAFALVTQIPMIQNDLALDRKTVEAAFTLQATALIDAVVAARTKKK